MLVEFRVKNFLSFKDEQVFSLVANKDPSLPGHVHCFSACNDLRLLKAAVIYGPNASGKSNLIKSINFFNSFVSYSANESQAGQPIPVSPFRLDQRLMGQPSEFEASFVLEGIRYQYGFSVDREAVRSEWLFAYPKGASQLWFERKQAKGEDQPSWRWGSHLKGEKLRLSKMVRPNSLYLPVAAKFNHDQLKKAFTWIYIELRNLSGCREDEWHGFQNYSAQRVLEGNRQKAEILDLVRQADSSIVDIEIVPNPMEPEHLSEMLDKDTLKLFIEKRLKFVDIRLSRLQQDGGKAITFSLLEESDGTNRLFAMSGPIQDTLQNGWTLCFDELHSSLHPLLSRRLVDLFHDEKRNPKGAQLIFTTHDATLLDQEVFRRDQIWFIEKDRLGASHVYPLTDFSPRKDKSLQRGYLAGRYGALPFFGDLDQT